ncbi:MULTISPECIES: VanZ family protein [Bacillaceae]|uniref:VanZ family protein n=1 Tax=Bacillaceae TaxID=186817 RepID=UPI001FE96BB9|nr:MULTISPECIES: VanZ family protein [Bacillaceae]
MRINKYIAWGAVVIWMGLIFAFSHQPGGQSAELSSGVTELVLSTVESILPIEFDRDSVHYVIRKGAHFSVYFVLGILVLHALRRSGFSGLRSVLFSLGICVIYAITDEVHQLFIPGRSGEVTDVLIDSAGAGVGICLYVIGSSARHRWKKRKREKSKSLVA